MHSTGPAAARAPIFDRALALFPQIAAACAATEPQPGLWSALGADNGSLQGAQLARGIKIAAKAPEVVQTPVLSRKNPGHPDNVAFRGHRREALARACELAAGRLELGLTGLELRDIHHPDQDPTELARLAEGQARVLRRRASNIRRCGWEACDTGGALVRSSDGTVVVDGNGEPYLYGERCCYRFCSSCERRNVARTRRRLEPLLMDEGDASDFALLTLTRRADEGESCAQALATLDEGLRVMRRSRWFKRTWKAGIAGLEVTYSTPASRRKKAKQQIAWAEKKETRANLYSWRRWQAGDDEVEGSWFSRRLRKAAAKLRASADRLLHGGSSQHWHAHLHLVLVPRAKPQNHDERDQLRIATREAWVRALGVEADGANVFMERPRKALSEVVKYAVKGVDIVSMPQDRLVELLCAVEGRRLIRVLGDWYGRRETKDIERLHETPEVDERRLDASDPERIIGFAAGTDEKVKSGEVEIRCDDATLAAARLLKALRWEAKHAGRVLEYHAPAPEPVVDKSTGPPPKKFVLPARPVVVGGVAVVGARALTSSALSSAVSREKGERSAIAQRAEEARIERKHARSGGLDANGEGRARLVDSRGKFVRFIDDAEGLRLVAAGDAAELTRET